MISEHSAHSTPQPFGIRTWLWRYTCLLLLISMFWHRQAIFQSKGNKLSSFAEGRNGTHQGLRHQIASRLNARWQTDWPIEDQAKKLELDSPSLWLASIQPTRPHRCLAFAPGSGDKHVCRIWTRDPRHQIASRLNARWQTDWAIEDQAKNLNSTAYKEEYWNEREKSQEYMYIVSVGTWWCQLLNVFNRGILH